MDNQEAKRDNGKVRLSLVPTEFVKAVARVREFGVLKYGGPDNWKQVNTARYKDALLRHVLAYMRNDNAKDGESDLPALWHIACNVAFLIERYGGDFPGGVLPDDVRRKWEAIAEAQKEQSAQPKREPKPKDEAPRDAPQETKVVQMMVRGIRVYGANHADGKIQKLRIDKGNMSIGDVFLYDRDTFQIVDETVAERVEILNG